ncbi:DnaJ domain-containing protein [Limibacillus halophilus]|uniref:J domain-containing protein n=1 Tax=Limibacillus halophilus TaxID=1579333 RepID=A0A839SPR7_9PROT|nr:DnaJ domain-containing protein [Limibacillus halophilus]MBB3064432.1 hypothetical protein [Limibacillus halophilus]
MVPYLLLALCLVVGFYLVGRWFVQADPKAVLKALGWTFGTIGVLAVLVIVAFKKFNLLIYTLPFLLPLMVRLPRLIRRLKTLRGAAPGGSSSVSTRFLRMELDHSTGRLDGEVREGPFEGQKLSGLTEEQLLELWRLCHVHDEESAAVLEAYLDRTRGDAWRDALNEAEADESARRRERAGASGSQAGSAQTGAMTREEALAVLGLEPDAKDEDIRKAHRRLMQQLHPDHGGSNYLAAKVNAAKQQLLGS